MPVKISYWAGWLLPQMEGISKEVFTLAHHFQPSFIFGLNKNYKFRFNWRQKFIGINIHFYPVFKCFAPFVESMFNITHIYDDLANWFYLKNLGRRPIVLTATTGLKPLSPEFYKKVATIVVDSESRYQELAKYFPSSKIKIVYPGVDLTCFQPVSVPPCLDKFKVLFASAPATSGELKGRGVWQILKAAALLPQIEFTLIWRPWGNALKVVQDYLIQHPLPNVKLVNQFIPDMAICYQQHHLILAPFAVGGGKPCPTSVVEALACGLPVVVGPGIGIASLLIEQKAGLSAGSSGETLARAIIECKANWQSMHESARAVAEEYFDLRKTLKKYAQIYQNILSS